MSQDHEKIIITESDVSGISAPKALSTSTPPPKVNPWAVVCGVLGAVVLFAFGLYYYVHKVRPPTPPEPTIEQWVEQERKKLSAALQTSQDWRNTIESIHPLVTYKGGNVSQFIPRTVDGTRRLGKNASNISEVELLVTFNWEGPLTKDGYTEVRFVYDWQNDKCKLAQFERSNALINLATVDWFKVGFAVGSLLF